MYKYTPVPTKKFLKQQEKAKKRGLNLELLATAIDLLASGEPMPPEYNDHNLKGNLKDFRECHIGGKNSDWILIYRIYKSKLILSLSATGSHSNLF
ncbi:MAG: type II toxin-antitoxin system YafQ family toxin [Clostridiales bacterium]|jgi:mRNA interferase YafQ|nr:type II toxin-antitoxin system YafQ family toxin [Clostridiales bacterium]